MAHGDSARGRDALRTLDFHVHLDLFMSPTGEQADIVLPVTGAFEAEGLNIGFEVSQEAQSLVQLRAPLVPPVGEARSDIEVIFDLATRLGLGEHFFGGDVGAGWSFQLAPSGVTLQQLRDDPAGIRLPLETRHRGWYAASTAGSNRVRNWISPAIPPSVPAAPTSTWCSARRPATRSAAARPSGPRSARSDCSPKMTMPKRSRHVSSEL